MKNMLAKLDFIKKVLAGERATLMVKKILILGASGMLGGSLFRYLSEIKSLDILGTVRSKSASEELRLRGFNNFETESTPAALKV